MNDSIMGDLRERKGLERNDSSMDNEILRMSKTEMFAEVCNWNGLINFDGIIKNWIEKIYGIDLDNFQ